MSVEEIDAKDFVWMHSIVCLLIYVCVCVCICMYVCVRVGGVH